MSAEKGQLPGPIRYAKPNGRRHGIRWTDEEQESLKYLSQEGTIKSGADAIHQSLPPTLDVGGRRLTKAMRDALRAAVKARALPPPHPDRQAAPPPTDALAEELELRMLRELVASQGERLCNDAEMASYLDISLRDWREIVRNDPEMRALCTTVDNRPGRRSILWSVQQVQDRFRARYASDHARSRLAS